MKFLKKYLFHRVTVVAVAILLQLLFFLVILGRFYQYSAYFIGASYLLSYIAVLWIIYNKSNPAFKIAWIIPILAFPIFGGIFYLCFGKTTMSKREREKMEPVGEKLAEVVRQDETVLQELKEDNLDAYNQVNYLFKNAHAVVSKGEGTEYMPLGEIKFEKMKEELRKAQKYIFLEYFIIEEGVMWDSILEILEERAGAGVDVRVIYDDAGCLFTLPKNYKKTLDEKGIKCSIFNPIIPYMSVRMNNRDHRKITVVDGHTAFIGGINLADEYINVIDKHGHWKDTALLFKGEAAWNTTLMFLGLWDALNNIAEDMKFFKPDEITTGQDGYIQPFTDSPLDGEPVGEIVYLNLINKAKKSIYITSPYLIIDNEMITALTTAAKSGIDVRIITPHIEDKALVHMVTRSYYRTLVESGVKIYEYTPGFVHAKTYVIDDEFAVVGTINMDYRSLYLHFECGVFLYKNSAIEHMKSDFFETLEKSQEYTIDELNKIKWYKGAAAMCLRIIAPLM